MQSLGVIRQITRYPVKSMQGEALPTAALTLQGFAEDRRYAFVQAASRSSFPWLTARELPELLYYRTTVEKAGTPEVGVRVATAHGENWPIESDDLRKALEARSGRPLFLLRDYRGLYDVAPVSLISRQTVARIAEESGTKENSWRFRPNLLVDLQDPRPFDELQWVGKTLQIGSAARIAITEVDQRCVMITLDPASGESSPEILKCVVQKHGQSAGIYAAVLTPGEVRAGDPILIEE
jgi:MOSC domain-containing protein